MKLLKTILIIAVLICVIIKRTETQMPWSETTASTMPKFVVSRELADEFYYGYNDYRKHSGLDTLAVDSILELSATRHSVYMMVLNVSGKISEFGTTHMEDIDLKNVDELLTPSDRVYAYDPTKRYHIAENVTGIFGRNFHMGNEILEQWINSPDHNIVLLSPKNRRMGIGIIKGNINGVSCMYVTLVVTD